MECFFPKIRNKVRMSSLSIPIQSHNRSPIQCNKARKMYKNEAPKEGYVNSERQIHLGKRWSFHPWKDFLLTMYRS